MWEVYGILYLIFGATVIHAYGSNSSLNHAFPPGFLIGCATSAYQVEGCWNADGKGESIQDHLVHTQPWMVENEDNGDEACNSYCKYKEDVQMVKDIGFDHYRFSISWSRILPTGFDNVVNRAGITYYHKLIDELIANGIIPVVTIYHFDLPQPLQDLGGWPNPIIADYFVRYARVLFNEYGHKVKYWITVNEPVIAALGYDKKLVAPILVNINGVGSYLSIYTMLLGHARVYHMYDKEFRPYQHGNIVVGKIGMTASSPFVMPRTNKKEDIDAANRALEFQLGIVAHPIFSRDGDFPPVVRERVDKNSRLQGWSKSRLPSFTKDEIRLIRGTADFFGLNHYTTHLAEDGLEGLDPSMARDAGAKLTDDPCWKKGRALWQMVVPSGFRGLLNFIRTSYDNPPVFIFENGLSTDGNQTSVESQLNDISRVEYHHDYLEEMLKAIYIDGCKVIGYTVWSLMDNLEFLSGFTVRFGIYHVDINNPSKPRTKKKSANYFKKLMETRTVIPTAYV